MSADSQPQVLQNQGLEEQIPAVGVVCVVRMPGQDVREAVRLPDKALGDGTRRYQFEDVVGAQRFMLEEREVLAHVRAKVPA